MTIKKVIFMSVKKIKIVRNKNKNKSITIPLNIEAVPMDNTNLIDDEFVKVERKKILNPIIDYEKIRAFPYFSGTTIENNSGVFLVRKIIYNLSFYDGNTWGNKYGSPELGEGTYSDDDLKYRLNRFKNSFLRIMFNETNAPTTTKLLNTQIIYTQLGDDNVYIYKETPIHINETNKKAKVGTPLLAKDNPVRFVIGDNKYIKNIEPDGYFLYWHKDKIPYNTYISYTFNNAKNGKVFTLTSKDIEIGGSFDPITISDVNIVSNIPIEIKFENNVYKYIFKPGTDHTGLTYRESTKTLTIKLCQRKSNKI